MDAVSPGGWNPPKHGLHRFHCPELPPGYPSRRLKCKPILVHSAVRHSVGLSVGRAQTDNPETSASKCGGARPHAETIWITLEEMYRILWPPAGHGRVVRNDCASIQPTSVPAQYNFSWHNACCLWSRNLARLRPLRFWTCPQFRTHFFCSRAFNRADSTRMTMTCGFNVRVETLSYLSSRRHISPVQTVALSIRLLKVRGVNYGCR